MEGGKWIKLRGLYADNAGGQAAIVNGGPMMWYIDTLGYASQGDVIFVPPSDCLVGQTESGGRSKPFRENCVAAVSQNSLSVRSARSTLTAGSLPRGALSTPAARSRHRVDTGAAYRGPSVGCRPQRRYRRPTSPGPYRGGFAGFQSEIDRPIQIDV